MESATITNLASTWSALRNPTFRKLWLGSLVSGTCVAAHDTAATWVMNTLTASPFLTSLMSTVASLLFLIFTLPAGAHRRYGGPQEVACSDEPLVNNRGGRLSRSSDGFIFSVPMSS